MTEYNNASDYQASQYNILSGGANNTLNNIPPGSSGTVLTSNGVSAQPSFQSVASSTFPWTVVSGTEACTINNGYISSGTSLVTMDLPSTAAVGNEIKFSNIGSGFVIQPAYGQTVSLLSQTATYPSNLQTNVSYAAADLICSNANTSWNVINSEGTFTQGILTSALSGTFYEFNLIYLKANGSPWSSGSGLYGQIGNQTTTSYSSPVAAVGNFIFIQIYGSDYSVIGLSSNGSCWTWGNNTAGQLGNQTTTSYSSPISVVGNHSFVQVYASYQVGYGLKANGSCWAWGYNNAGQLGNQTVTSYSSPISVVGSHSFIQIAAGYEYTLGLKADGSCWTWGINNTGQLGTQNATSYSSPISVVGSHSFIQVIASYQTSYGLKADGSCWAWGSGLYGQIGNQTTTSYSSPISVVGNHSFIQIGSASYCLYGLKSNGQIWCCGYNSSGELGNQSNTSYSSPISVVGGFSFVKLLNTCGNDANVYSAGGWLSNGQIWAWGYNGAGLLGNNTTTNYSSPILVLNTP